MRHGKNYRLGIALSQLTKRPQKWTPPQGELADRPQESAHADLLEEIYRTWRDVALEQGTAPTSWPVETMMHRRARRNTMDLIIAQMSDAEAHAAFENAALAGHDAEVDLLPASESVGLPVPEYSTRWRRASDETFAYYAPLAQRRPA